MLLAVSNSGTLSNTLKTHIGHILPKDWSATFRPDSRRPFDSRLDVTAPRGVVTSSRESNGRRLSGRKVADQSFGRMWPLWVFRGLVRVPLLLTASNIAYSGNDRQQETTG